MKNNKGPTQNGALWDSIKHWLRIWKYGSVIVIDIDLSVKKVVSELRMFRVRHSV